MADVSLKSLVKQRMSKSVKFMDSNVRIFKLSVSEVISIQEKAKEVKEDETKGYDILKLVIRNGIESGDDLTDEDFSGFPLDELSKLSAEIMKYSGLGENQGK